MPKILVIYASTHGHTARIAARIGAALEEEAVAVELHDVRAGGADPAPVHYDAVIAGGSIHAGHYQRELVQWAERHRSELQAVPSAFFSVCLTAADDTEESRQATGAYIDDFVAKTRWTPARTATFAGALQYREYDFVTRLMMRLLMRHMHPETDASRDYDYTDWDAVDRWARELLPAGSTDPAAARDRELSGMSAAVRQPA